LHSFAAPLRLIFAGEFEWIPGSMDCDGLNERFRPIKVFGK
jgi:hypothetical protein